MILHRGKVGHCRLLRPGSGKPGPGCFFGGNQTHFFHFFALDTFLNSELGAMLEVLAYRVLGHPFAVRNAVPVVRLTALEYAQAMQGAPWVASCPLAGKSIRVINKDLRWEYRLRNS